MFGLVLAFVIIIGLSIKGISISLALFLGGLAIAIPSGMGLGEIVTVGYRSAVEPATLQLAGSVVALQLLGYMLKESGMLNRMVAALTKMVRDPRLLTALLPMLIGLLTVPGGAIMSAPLVQQTGEKAGIGPLDMATANLMFRHLWYLIYPLYPLFVFVSDLSGIQPGEMISYLALPTLVGCGTSAWVCFGKSRVQPGAKKPVTWETGREFVMAVSPILAIVLARFILGLEYFLAVVVGTLVGGFFFFSSGRHSRPGSYLWEILCQTQWNFGLVVITVMMMQGYVIESGTVNLVAEAMDRAGLPLIIMAVVIPFVTGLLTGSTYSGIGISFAIFGPMIEATGLAVSYYGLVFVAGVIGYQVSPVHLCLVLTKEYFGVPLGALLRKLALPQLAMLGTAVILTLILGLV